MNKDTNAKIKQMLIKGDKKVADLEFTETRAAGDGYNVGTGDAPHNSLDKGKQSVPETISSTILRAVREADAGVFGMAPKIMLDGTFRFVLEAKPTQKAGFVKEGATIPKVDGTFQKVELRAKKAAGITKITREAIEDVNFDIVPYITERLTESMLKGFEYGVIAGKGATAGEPEGLLSYDTSAGALGGYDGRGAAENVTEEAGKIKATDVIKAYYDLPQKYRDSKDTIFLCHDSVLKELALNEDKIGRSLLDPTYSGVLNTIMGKRIVTSEFMPKVAENAVSAMFVHVPDAIQVGLSRSLDSQVLTELYATNDVIGYKATARFDSKIIYNCAISAIKVKE